ncbi:MAG TPA: ATP-binding protein [Acidimicrobiales bacterium]|nr:ATP-binding protein [Acidimicrobiales bacterium]
MSSGADRIELVLDPRPESLPEARHRVEAWLTGAGVPDAVAADLVTAVGELCTNAVQAAESRVAVRGRIERESVVIEVHDDGPGFTGKIPEIEPDPLADAGRGLFIVQKLVDVLWLSADGELGGTVARAARRFR